MKYAVIFEKTETNYGAWVPDLPGCVAAGNTLEEAERRIREAMAVHIRGMIEDGEPLPESSVGVSLIEVDLARDLPATDNSGQPPRADREAAE
ncbi:MAG TPA: type II toxin-antitoxin system HicB family antitoxin [bacterium]|nr:type II toxin-antitoxin system HicB family antitoxin [bacterium]